MELVNNCELAYTFYISNKDFYDKLSQYYYNKPESILQRELIVAMRNDDEITMTKIINEKVLYDKIGRAHV